MHFIYEVKFFGFNCIFSESAPTVPIKFFLFMYFLKSGTLNFRGTTRMDSINFSLTAAADKHSVLNKSVR